MIVLSSTCIFSIAFVTLGIGYTLLMYSRDGDMDLVSTQKQKLKSKIKLGEIEMWESLQALIQAESTEVTWNTSMFVSLVSSFMFLGFLSYSKKHELTSTTVAILWILSLLSVFFLQDLIIRWKSAHRRSASTFEKLGLVEQLRWSRTFGSNIKQNYMA